MPIAPPNTDLSAAIATLTTSFYWGPGNITFSTPTAGSVWPGYAAGSEPFNAQYSAMSITVAAQFRLALQRWDELIARNIVEVTEPGAVGNIRAAFTDVNAFFPGAWGYASYPSFQGGAPSSGSGDIWIDYIYRNNSFAVGSYDFFALMHEIGHALGLEHPFEANPPLALEFDNYRYSIMSYTGIADGTHVLFSATANGGIQSDFERITNGTPGLFDIAAIQSVYGADPTTRVGNSTYTWNPSTALIEVIYDAGGIDTFDLTGHSRPSFLDLRPGAFSSVDVFSRAAQVEAAVASFGEQYRNSISATLAATPDLFTWDNNVGIALNTTIENANLGSGDDGAIGNDANNLIFGNDGRDALDGLAGGDTLYGGNGNDILSGSSGADALIGGAGADALIGGTETDLAVLSGLRSNYATSKSAGVLYINDLRNGSPDGLDQAVGVERFQFAGGITLSMESLTPVNFNGDLNSDLLWANTNGQAVSFLLNGTAVTTANVIGTANGSTWHVRAVGDLNGDGSSDLIWQNDTGLVVAYIMIGTTIATAISVGNMTADFRVAGSGDLNGDGQSDIIVQNSSGLAIGLLMSGGAIIGSGSIGAANGAAWSITAVGDLNADGRADLVWENTNGSTVGYIMNGLAVASAAQIAGANGTTFSVNGIGDLNGDGKGDIVWQFSNGQAGAWLMDGTSIIGGNLIGGVNGSNYEVREIADISGDGLMDLVWQNTSNGQAVGFIMNGTTIASAGNIGGANGVDWLIV